MAAVLAAILAAFLAGGIALFRERRLEARRLRVAARIIQATLAEALNNSSKIPTGKIAWENFALKPTRDEILETWKEHRDILAGHLSRTEWTAVFIAIDSYLILFHLESDPERDEEWELLWKEIQERLIAASDSLSRFCD